MFHMCVFLGYISCSIAYDNLALGKPTYQQYRFNWIKERHTQSSNAVDGLKPDLDHWGGQCAISALQKRTATWWVNLTSIFSIHHITVYYQRGNAEWGRNNHYTRSFLGFSLYVSNTTNKSDGMLCYKDTHFTLDTIPPVFNTTCLVRGQYVIYYNERLAEKTYPDEYSTYAYYELCEVEVFGCPNPHCRYCHIQTGTCRECEPGYQGPRCELVCETVRYETMCVEECGHCRYNQTCKVTNGICLRGCDPGFYGKLCKTRCDEGMYGFVCNESCGYCRNGKNCDKDNGSCSNGCSPGYVGDLCKTNCSQGLFGLDCLKACNITCIGCDNVNGMCDSGCYEGWRGNYCEKQCESGTYGKECNEACGFCLNQENCHHVNGSCLTGCDAGYYGDLCKTACSIGTYGLACGNLCGYCLDQKDCHHINGTCLSECKPGYTGDNCSLVCDQGKYGRGCNEKCGHCQDEYFCRHTDGACPTGCDSGYLGDLCQTQCNGSYGENCSSMCGNCSNGDPCHHINGSCLHGCDPGYQEPFCIEAIIFPRKKDNQIFLATGAAVGLTATFTIGVIFLHINIIRKKRAQTLVKQKAMNSNQERQQNIECEILINDADIVIPKSTDNGPIQEKNLVQVEVIPREDQRRETDEDCLKEDNDVCINVALSSDIPVNKFELVIAEKRAKGNNGFNKEYSALPSGEVYPCDVGKLPENNPKNRIKTIFPYDHSRVILHTSKIEPSDYINANYIDGTNRPKEYIATQGPQPNTLGDFWRMVWQENVLVIVMLTNLKEGDNLKCTQYWPDVNQAERFGSLSVKLMELRKYAFFIERKLSISNMALKKTRVVTQFHYASWPDHGCPDVIHLLDFHHHVLSSTKENEVPTVVHCSAGVGRTGTFIALDALYQEGKKTGKVNVSEFVKTMRSNRVSMVQTNEQYITIYYALNDIFKAPIRRYSVTEFCTKTEKVLQKDQPEHNSFREEFQLLRQVTPNYSKTDYELARRLSKSSQKDRVLPLDKYTLHLLPMVRKRGTFINAIYAPSFRKAKRFIVTHYPTPGDVADFLRLLNDHESDTVICLDAIDYVKSVWLPSLHSSKVVAPFTIHCQSTSSNDVTTHVIHILNNTQEDSAHTVLVVSPRSIINPFRNPLDTSEVRNLVSAVLSSKTEKPITVASSDGASLCGVFIAVHNAVQQLEMDGNVDVFTPVRQLQVRRPELCGSIEEYSLINMAVYDYIQAKSEDTLCNN